MVSFRNLGILCLKLVVITMFFGCAQHPVGKILSRNEVVAMNESGAERAYQLQPGDRIAIKFFYNKSLNDEVDIRPDGKISLQLIDSVMAAGHTPEELDSILTQAYAKAFQTSQENFALSIGDTISIKSYYNDKLNEDVLIRPDGKISLQLIDDVVAAGLTPAELDDVLTARYSKFLNSPDISVIVRDFKLPDLTVVVRDIVSQKIYVGGEVKSPGVMPLKGKRYTFDAILQAGGYLETAQLDHVILMRQNGTPQPDIYTINLTGVMRGEEPDVALRAYDIVYLPETAISQVETFLHNIYDLIPANVLFSFVYDFNNELRVK